MKTGPTEDELVRGIVPRLRARFPALDEAVLGEVVRESYRRFDEHQVRDYVPILTERAAVAECRRRSS